MQGEQYDQLKVRSSFKAALHLRVLLSHDVKWDNRLMGWLLGHKTAIQ